MRAVQIVFLSVAWFWVLAVVVALVNDWVQREWQRHLTRALDRSSQRAYRATRGVTRP